jgi:hypothetical protein
VGDESFEKGVAFTSAIGGSRSLVEIEVPTLEKAQGWGNLILSPLLVFIARVAQPLRAVPSPLDCEREAHCAEVITSEERLNGHPQECPTYVFDAVFGVRPGLVEPMSAKASCRYTRLCRAIAQRRRHVESEGIPMRDLRDRE